MLTISKPLSSGQAHSYHDKEFANADQNYYSQAGGVRGEWQGELAKAWGLVGEVHANQFHRLAEGQHPETGEQLVKHRIASQYQNGQGETVCAASHRAGWDATFSAPKSVSITALVGGDERVREAHRESVRIALNELEHYVQARIGGNHPAETSGKMVAAKFEHDSARPVNGYAAPQLHTHTVIFNITETGDGKTHALQPRELYRTQRYATAVYRSELATRLRTLGYELDCGANGEFEIKGYSAEYLAASSPRRQQIKQYLKAIGLEGAEAAEIGAHRTREAKIHINPEEMKRINLTLAAQHGNDPQAVVAQARNRQRHIPEAAGNFREAARQNPVAQMALTYARDRNMEREATVEERVLLQDALKRAMGEATLGEIRENLAARLKSGEFVTVSNATTGREGQVHTTAQMRGVERENIATMQSGQGLGEPLVRPKAQRRIESEFQHFTGAQRQAVREVLESRDRFTGLQGVAGSGKTMALAAVRRATEAEGYRVQGFAPTSRAAHQLEEAGIPSTTLQRFLTQPRAAENEGRRLYVLDESSLASTKLVHDLLKRLGEKDRVLLVGDTRQHQAVEAGRPFQQMQEAGMRTVQLDEILRQKDPDLKQAVELVAQGQVKEAIQQMDRQGRVHEIPGAQERLEAIARDYLRQPEGTFVISPDNRSRSQINHLVHESLKAQESLSQQEYTVTVLVNRQDLTGADRQWAAQYQPGDAVRYTRGSRQIGVEAGRVHNRGGRGSEPEPAHRAAPGWQGTHLRSAEAAGRERVPVRGENLCRRRAPSVHSALQEGARCQP